MNTRRNAAQRLEEEVANAGTPSPYKQLHPLEENSNGYQAPANPQPMTEAEMRDILYQMAKAMSTQAQAATVQVEATLAQANQDVAPRPHQQVTTMASRLRDFTQMNPPTFYGSKVDEDRQEFLDDVYIVL